MTFRAKPVVKRDHRPAWETRDRRNHYLNIGFGIVVIIGVAVLLIAAGLNYYDQHLASVGSVNGRSISRDALRDRVQVDTWRLDEAKRRISTAVVAGRLTQAQADQQLQTIEQARTQIAGISLERLIDANLQAQLAAEEGVTVAPDEIDARFIEDATTPEQRHVWAIEVEPVTELGAIEPTADQIAEAKAKAEAALADLNAGTAWEDVAKTVSTDTATAPLGGEIGWLQADDSRADEGFLKAVFAAPANEPTAIVLGEDGVFRTGRATEITPEKVDAQYQVQIVNDGVSLDLYRTVLAADVLHAKLQDKLVADVTGEGPQRRVSEIYTSQAAPNLEPDAVKTRHILFSPNGDPSNAANVPDGDPAWEIARARALATYGRLTQDPALFDAIARAESDEEQANGPAGSGGKLPYFDSKSSVDDAFLAAIMVPGLENERILEPVKSAFGWHVIQMMNRPTDEERFAALKAEVDGGADFAILARDNSTGPTAGTGGDLGWVAKGQLDDQLTDTIFATPIGQTSDVITVVNDGTYLFKLLAEEVRTPAGRQLEELTSTAFSTWYDAKKAAAEITREGSDAATSIH
jgi:parvulin-like peptidyl-prolyl isomerase